MSEDGSRKSDFGPLTLAPPSPADRYNAHSARKD